MANQKHLHDRWPGDREDHRSLSDAYTRISEALSDFASLETEVRNFVRRTVEMMVRGRSGEHNTFVVSLPPAKLAHKGEVNNKIRLLCGKISENLRAALDYSILSVSRKTEPNLIEREITFILASSAHGFDTQAKRALKHIGNDIQCWMRNLQPYCGNEILAFIRDTSNVAKHRRLLEVRHATNLTIILRRDTDQRRSWEESGWWIFPAEDGHAFFTRIGTSQLIINNKYDALIVFPMCIDHVERIVNTLEYYLQDGHLPEEDGSP